VLTLFRSLRKWLLLAHVYFGSNRNKDAFVPPLTTAGASSPFTPNHCRLSLLWCGSSVLVSSLSLGFGLQVLSTGGDRNINDTPAVNILFALQTFLHISVRLFNILLTARLSEVLRLLRGNSRGDKAQPSAPKGATVAPSLPPPPQQQGLTVAINVNSKPDQPAPTAEIVPDNVAARAQSSIRTVHAGLFLCWLLCAFFFIAHCFISSPLLSASMADRMVIAAYCGWLVAGLLMVAISLGFNRSIVNVLRMGMSTLSSAHQKQRQDSITKLSTIRAPLVISISLTSRFALSYSRAGRITSAHRFASCSCLLFALGSLLLYDVL
jgi:hypothetical protein